MVKIIFEGDKFSESGDFDNAESVVSYLETKLEYYKRIVEVCKDDEE